MILRYASSVIALGLTAFFAVPAHADVMEIDGGEAQWIAGPNTSSASQLSAPVSIGEVPDEARAVPDHAIANITQHSAAIPARYVATIAQLSAHYDLSPALLEALVWQESRWRETAVSPAGARGLAQLMPGTARYLGVDADDPFANLEGGARYLREQLDRFDGDLEKALAAYNAGPGRVIRAGGIPRIAETQKYVAAIMGRLSNHSRSPE